MELSNNIIMPSSVTGLLKIKTYTNCLTHEQSLVGFDLTASVGYPKYIYFEIHIGKETLKPFLSKSILASINHIFHHLTDTTSKSSQFVAGGLKSILMKLLVWNYNGYFPALWKIAVQQTVEVWW